MSASYCISEEMAHRFSGRRDATNISNRGEYFQSRATEAKQQNFVDTKVIGDAKKVEVPTPFPLSFLRSLFASSSAHGQQLTAQPCQIICHKPSQAEINAYDLESVRAIQKSDIETLRSMVRDGKSMNASNRFGESLIAMACRRGNAEVVQFLIREAEVRLDIIDDYGRTPLHDACWTALPNTVSY
jgi:hypothetical protein